MSVLFTRPLQICNLEEQLEQFREELENKSEEVQQLHMQLEIQRKEIISQQDYLETRDSLLQVRGQEQFIDSFLLQIVSSNVLIGLCNPSCSCVIYT